MKSNLFCIFLASTAITSASQEPSQDILENFLSPDLLFRDECVNNYNNDDCQTIRNAVITHYKYGCALKCLEKNEEYLITQYRQEKPSFVPFSSRNPKTRNIHQAFITKHVSEKLFEDEGFKEQLEAAAVRLIIQSTVNQPKIDQHEQFELVRQSMGHAVYNQSQEKA